MDEFGKYQMNSLVKHPYAWTKGTVTRILSNPIYLGKLVSLRYQTRSFKDKRIIPRPEEEWITVENTHQALVDQETFDLVQERISVKQRATWEESDNMFRGLLICSGCNTRMVFARRTGRTSKGSFCCNKHRRYGGTECSAHYITLEQVQEILLEDIRRHANLCREDKEAYVAFLVEASEKGAGARNKNLMKEMEACTSRLEQLDVILNQLYEDHALHKIPDDRYVTMSDKYSEEYRTVKAQLSKLEEDRSVFSRKIRQADSFSQLIEEYSDITELTSELLHTLIDHVVVHEKEEIDGEVVMRFDIHYRFIGRVGDANGDDTVIKPTKNAVTMYKNRVLG